MVKGGKRHFPASKGGEWFAHPGSPESEIRSRETCTSTGIMLNQAKALLPQALNTQRYPKWNIQQKPREYPLSCHDNKYSLKDDISVFTQGVGRWKCPDDRRQNNSHLCLCQDEADSSNEAAGGKRNKSIYRSDFTVMAAVDAPVRTRRFPCNHKQRSEEAALEQARKPFMWLGRDNSDISETLEVQTAPSKP